MSKLSSNKKGDMRDFLAERHSLFTTKLQSPNEEGHPLWKSDLYLVPPNELTRLTGGRDLIYALANDKNSGDYYKNYDCDEIPVKEKTVQKINSKDRKSSISETELLSTDLTDEYRPEDMDQNNSFSSLESNIKFFKTTVQQIFDNFYSTMKDFELYKKKFQLILEKNKAESITEMEEFIKDMIQHIMSSETFSNRSEITNQTSEVKDQVHSKDSSELSEVPSASNNENLQSVYEAFKNSNYIAESLGDERSVLTKGTLDQDTLSFFLLSNAPFLEIKMSKRTQLSESNIQITSKDVISARDVQSKVASAEDIKKLAAKRKELENYVQQVQYSKDTDEEIPVKISTPKKNIHLDEDFNARGKREKPFLLKLCGYICKRFRRSN